MYSSLEEVQKHSAKQASLAIAQAHKLGKESFFILEIVRTIGMDEDTKYRVDIRISDRFSVREVECLGFNTMLTHFSLSPKRDRYIAKTIYHVLDKEQVMMVSNIKESEFIKRIKLIEDPIVRNAINDCRKHAKRLLSGRRSK